MLSNGDKSFLDGNYADARQSYRRATQADPRFAEAYYKLGLTEQKLENFWAAFQAMGQANRLSPQRKDIKIALADVCLAGLGYDSAHAAELRRTAVRISDELVGRDPKSAAGLRIQGDLAMLDHRPGEAVEFFRAVRGQRPDDSAVAVRLINSLVLSGGTREAEQVAMEHITAHKTDADVYDAIFAYYSQNDRIREAERTLKLKISNNPIESKYVTQLSAFYWKLGLHDQALELVMRMLVKPPRAGAARLAAGDFYSSIGRPDEGKRQFEEGMRVDHDPSLKIQFQERLMKIAMGKGNLDEAASLADRVLEADPQNSEALAARAGIRVKSGQPAAIAAAIEDYKILLRRNSRDPKFHYSFGRALQLKGDLASAKAEIYEAIRLDSKVSNAKQALAEIALDQHNWQEALEFTQAALSDDPRDARASLLKAQALCEAGRCSEGCSVLELLISAAPDNKTAYLQLALLEIDQREFSKAEAAFSKLQSLASEGFSLPSLDADARPGQLDHASAILKKELERSPNHPVVHNLLASVAVEARQYDRAISEYHALLLINPNSSSTHLRMAQVFQLKGDMGNSISSLERAQRLFPADFSLTAQLAYALQAAGRQEEAIQQFRRALQAHADDSRLLNSLAAALVETNGSLDEALRMAQRAVQKSPRQAQFIDTLGWIYLKKKMTGDAVELFSDLVKNYPDDATFRYHLGAALFEKGDRPAARQELLIALAGKPSKESVERIRELLTQTN